MCLRVVLGMCFRIFSFLLIKIYTCFSTDNILAYKVACNFPVHTQFPLRMVEVDRNILEGLTEYVQCC